VGEVLALLMKKALEEGVIQWLVPHLVDGEIAILQYVDDTILPLEDSLENAGNMKFILCSFQQFLG
jgi:hypothetical protein